MKARCSFLISFPNVGGLGSGSYRFFFCFGSMPSQFLLYLVVVFCGSLDGILMSLYRQFGLSNFIGEIQLLPNCHHETRNQFFNDSWFSTATVHIHLSSDWSDLETLMCHQWISTKQALIVLTITTRAGFFSRAEQCHVLGRRYRRIQGHTGTGLHITAHEDAPLT